MKTLFIILILVLSLSVLSFGDVKQPDTTEARPDESGSPTVVISIDRLVIDPQRSQSSFIDTVSVWLESEVPIAAFDLKIAATGSQFEIIDLLAGELCDSCNWEFFDSHAVRSEDQLGSVTSVWQAVALAQVLPDSGRQVCYSLKDRSTLLKVVLSYTNRSSLNSFDTFTPLFFRWEDCTDNTISDQTGDSLWVSQKVLGFAKVDDGLASGLFPTSHGLPQECLKQNRVNRPRRRIEFRNGGIELESVEIDSVSDTLIDSLR